MIVHVSFPGLSRFDWKKFLKGQKLSESEIEQKLKELGDYDPTLELSSFQMPKIDLLKDYGESEIKIDKDELESNKNKIPGVANLHCVTVQCTS